MPVAGFRMLERLSEFFALQLETGNQNLFLDTGISNSG
jgi:hypothetical protein